MKKKLNLSIIILGISLLSSTAQIYPVRPQLSDKHSFSMILLPDPQSYNKFDANQPLFELQTAWVANSIEPLNIKGVLCTGDLVEQNEIRIPDGINGNQTSEEQWQAASRAFERLDDKISYVIPEITITDMRKQKTASVTFLIISLPSGIAAGKNHWSRQA